MYNEFLPVDSEKVIPHRPPFMFLSSLEKWDEKSAAGKSIADKSNLFLDKSGRLDYIYCIELIAQLTAASRGFYAFINKVQPKIGFLIGASGFKFSNSDIFIQNSCIIESSFILQTEFANVNIVEGKVNLNGQTIGSGIVKIWEVPEPPAQSAKDILPDISGLEQFSLLQIINPERKSRIYNDIQKCIIGVKTVSDSEKEIFYKIPADFEIFKGHFPVYPIFPGVLFFNLGLQTCEINLQKQLKITGVNNSKFNHPVLPDDIVYVTSSVKEKSGIYDISSEFYSDGRKIAVCNFSAVEDK